MSVPAPRLFFDYVDPCSYVVERRLRAAEEATGVEAARHPLELVPWPDPPPAVGDPDLAARWERARAAAEADGYELVRPSLVPWSRKAHELVLHAREEGAGRRVHESVFRAYHLEGRDIGRVDVLVELAVEAGLDLTATKAVLDVDRHLETLRALRRVAERLSVHGVPTFLAEDRTVEGIPEVATLASALTPTSPETP